MSPDFGSDGRRRHSSRWGGPDRGRSNARHTEAARLGLHL